MADTIDVKDMLPTSIVTPGDVRRLRREIESIDEFLTQSAHRQGGDSVKMPQTSRLLEEIVGLHDVNLLHKSQREKLLKYLASILEASPVMNFSFASDPSPVFTSNLLSWLRNNIHPQVLIKIGLQPSIAVGCTVRTVSKSYDFSLRQAFEAQRPNLIKVLKSERKDAA